MSPEIYWKDKSVLSCQKNWALATHFQRFNTSTSFILIVYLGKDHYCYLWDRFSSFQSDLRAGQRRLLQQTHHWSRKNWQHWLCMMCCQLKTTGWRQKRRIQQSQSGSPTANSWRGVKHTFRKIKLPKSPKHSSRSVITQALKQVLSSRFSGDIVTNCTAPQIKYSLWFWTQE